MGPCNRVGIVGYGGYVPRFRIDASEVNRVWKGEGMAVNGRMFKAVAGLDEDTITIAIQAARNAMKVADVNPADIGAVWFGTESKPYAVKPTSTFVADAIGALPFAAAADWEFACKPGTEAMRAAAAMVGSEMTRYAMFGGADTAQARPGDPLEHHSGAGGAAFVVGPADESLAVLLGSTTYVTNTPDFFRREGRPYPTHGQRFTGQPAYFHHICAAVTHLFEEMGTGPEDFTYAVFHQPNYQFPIRVGKKLGFRREQVEPFVLANLVGNTYSGASLLAFVHALDRAEPGDRILLASYGSGAGSDAASFLVTDKLVRVRSRGTPLMRYIDDRTEIDYATYARFTRKYRLT